MSITQYLNEPMLQRKYATMPAVDELKKEWSSTALSPDTPEYKEPVGNAFVPCRRVAEATMRRRRYMRAFWDIYTLITLAALVGALAGCSNGVSDSDVKFVAAGMPPQFESFRMYSAAPDSGGPVGGYAHPPARLQQGCQAIIRSASGHFRESVILESKSAESFDLDVERTSSGWTVTSDGLAPPIVNSTGLRTQFTNCVSAIEDKFRAEPEKIE